MARYSPYRQRRNQIANAKARKDPADAKAVALEMGDQIAAFLETKGAKVVQPNRAGRTMNALRREGYDIFRTPGGGFWVGTPKNSAYDLLSTEALEAFASERGIAPID